MLINHGVGGSWFNPATGGQGFLFETVPASNTLVVYWFTFDLTGGQREWYLATGDINGAAADLQVQRIEDGIFNQASAVKEVIAGLARIEFTDCTHAVFGFDLQEEGAAATINLQRLTPDVGCADQAEQSHTTFVTDSRSWLDARGTWVFEGCVELGASESHGREEFRFDGASLSFDIEHFNTSDCQGPMEIQSMSFELSRLDTIPASLGETTVIANRVVLTAEEDLEEVKQIFYFGIKDGNMAMAHGNFDGTLDATGYPAELHEQFFIKQP